MENIHTTNVMIDPSLMLAENTIANTFDQIGQLSEGNGDFKFYYPLSLRKLLSRYELEKESPGIEFFLKNAYPSVPAQLLKLMDAYSSIIQAFELTTKYREKYAEISMDLTEELGYRGELREELLRDVLFEEFVFLQEESYVVSRIGKSFNRFVAAGAVCVQFSSRTFDKLVRMTLKDKKQAKVINNADRLRAFAKLIALGGAPAAALIDPAIAAILVSAGLAYFVKFDPETA
jgi:hypothetical protein